jgi:8-amino-7-oxononanoate synthase
MQQANGSNDADGARKDPTPRPPGRIELEATLIELVARAIASPPEKVTLDMRLGADLGFDSLMVTELEMALDDILPGLDTFPRSLLADDATLAQVVDFVVAQVPTQATSVAAVDPDPPRARPVSGSPQADKRGDDGRLQPDPATYRIEQFPEVAALGERLQSIADAGLHNPYFKMHQQVVKDTTLIDGREYLNYASYNYLGLSGDEEVNRAVGEAIRRYGTSVSASRLVSGERPLHHELEQALAQFLGCEDAVITVSGYATNVGILGHLLGPEDVIIHDSLAHESILAGAKLSGARRRPFPHNNVDTLDRLLSQIRPHARRVLIAVEGVYSMDGDVAPLDQLIEVKKRHHALLYVDEAHSLGTLGKTGRGLGEHFAVNRADVDLWMGTLSKSLASCGGYIAGSHTLVRYLKYSCPGFLYSVGISPANAAAALVALEKLKREPERVATLQARSRLLLELFRERNIDTGLSQGSPVIPCSIPNSEDCMRLSQALYERGINVQPIVYPAVEENLARLRFFVTALHEERQMVVTANAVSDELRRLNTNSLKTTSNRTANPHR